MDRILVFGDSIVWGAWDNQGGWVQRLRRSFEKKNDYRFIIYNLGASYDSTTELLERLEFEIIHRTPKGKGLTIIFEIGLNDLRWLEDRKRFQTSQERFRKNIKNLIDISRRHTSKILFLGITPVKESKTTPVPWNKNEYYFNKDILKYDKILKDVCKKEKVPFIDIFEKFSKGKNKNLLEDLHPNSKGHDLIFKAVLEELKKNKSLLKNQ